MDMIDESSEWVRSLTLYILKFKRWINFRKFDLCKFLAIYLSLEVFLKTLFKKSKIFFFKKAIYKKFCAFIYFY